MDDALVRSIYEPACDPAAAAAFYKISGSGARSKLTLNELLRKLRAHEKPLLLCWGMKDPWMKPSKARDIMALYPGAELVEVAEGGHCPHDDDVATTNAALLRWASDVTARAA